MNKKIYGIILMCISGLLFGIHVPSPTAIAQNVTEFDRCSNFNVAQNNGLGGVQDTIYLASEYHVYNDIDVVCVF